ncbi:MAG: hypothetical protein E6G33_06385 [Actinobacteria bacterium]|nr:MAG: hypothetical protein E6G33_06385 [Actinomycetota bacterium]
MRTRSRSTSCASRMRCSPTSWGASRCSRPHGAPARVVLPEMYGYKGVKWLTRMELGERQPEGYWEQNGYDQDAWVGRSNGYHS